MGTTPRRDATILDRLLRHAEAHPERTLYGSYDEAGHPRSVVSYGTFLEQSDDVAAHLLAEGVCGPGDRVLLVFPPGIDMLTAFFACVRIGAIPVPVSPPSSHGFEASLGRMSHIARDCGATAVLTDRSYFWSIKLLRMRRRITRGFGGADDHTAGLPWLVTTDATPGSGRGIRRAPSEILFLQYTSGSTRDPKGVMVTHRNVLENGAAVFDHAPIGVSWLPQYHDMGLIGSCLFVALAGGTTHLFSPLDFLRRPVLWFEAMTRFRATASAAPSFAYQYCLRRDKVPDEALAGIDLASLRLLMNGAEPVRPDVFRRFRRRFEPLGLRPDALVAAYGLAEHTLAVSNHGRSMHVFDAVALARDEAIPAGAIQARDGAMQTPDGTASATTELVSCGRPLADAEVRIVGVDGEPEALPPGRVGEIWIDGPSKCAGYWNRPDLTRRTFEARLDSEPDRRWLRTGDLGFIHDGELFVCGRLKDVIIVRGLNYYPQDIEAVVEDDPAIRKGCVAAFSVERDGREALIVVAELRPGRRPRSVELLNQALRRSLGIVVDAVTYVRRRTIPKTSSGKIIRHQVRNRWQRGHLEVVATVESPVAGHVGTAGEDGATPAGGVDHAAARGTVAGVDLTFRRNGLSGRETITLADAGLDSLTLAELAQELEEHLDAVGAGGIDGGVDLRWLQRITISELSALVRDVVSATPGARQRLARAFTSVRRHQQEIEARMMWEDAHAPIPAPGGENEDEPRTSSNGAPRRSPRPGIFLTSGTGFFGPFLLRSLLEQSDDPVYVLVRAPDPSSAQARIEGAVAALGADLAPRTATEWRRRVVALCGDLSRPKLGLAAEAWERLTREAHTVFHNAAWVNYLLEYAVLRPTNVMGTREVVRLARSGEPKVLNHISTTFVFGWSTKETLLETDTNPDMGRLDFGYSQSKWVSERLVARALSEGLPGRIFRPALIAPSVCGAGGSLDIALRLLAFMQKHGIGTTAGNQVSLSPADLVADNIVAISGLPDTTGQTFHVTRDRRSTMQDVTDLLGEHTGRDFRHYPLRDFVPEVIARCGRDDPLFPLLNFLVRSVDNIAAMEFKEYDNRSYRRARARTPYAREDPPLGDVVGGIVRFMRRKGLVDPVGSPPVHR